MSIENKTDSPDVSSMDELLLTSRPSADRLPPMLFLAALVHGILILGITFNAMLGEEFSEAISLEVTILADPENNYVDTREAQYLAQASQEGEGNTTDAVRPTAPTHSEVPIDNIGVEEGDALKDSNAIQDTADQLLTTRNEQAERVPDNPREEPSDKLSAAILLEAGLEATLPLPQDRESTMAVRSDAPKKLFTSVDTRESRIAVYLDRWKRRIETMGVKYFPDLGIDKGLTGSPTLVVTINSSGQLDEARVTRSSGSRRLDQAALSILRRASPFDPFPESFRDDYDQLVFAYKWEFVDPDLSTTSASR